MCTYIYIYIHGSLSLSIYVSIYLSLSSLALSLSLSLSLSLTCKSSGLICGLDRTDSGPGDDNTERIGEEAHLGCAEDPGKEGPSPRVGRTCIALSDASAIYRATACLCLSHQQTRSAMAIEYTQTREKVRM